MTYKKFCEDLAREAGNIIKNNFSRNMSKEWKQDETPITASDIEINKLVINQVKEKFPEHDVLGEEENSISNGSDFIWVCDPVDGTIPFSHGIPIAVFSLALVHRGIPIVGVIYDPWIDRLYYAEKNKGCYLNNEKIKVNTLHELKRSVTGVATWKNAPFDLINLQRPLREKGAKLLELGSIVYQGMLVASGELSAVFFAGDVYHEAASLKIIVDEAGGKFTDLFGNEQKYDAPIKGFIASNGLLHDELVEMVSTIVFKDSE